jgi:hypothetical protein
MLTKPAKFAQHYRRDGAFRQTIVKIVNGSTTYLFGEIDTHLTDGPVYGILLSSSGAESSVDFFENEAGVGDLTLTFSNLKYNYYGASQRLSEHLVDLIGATVTVYLAAGPNITALSECMAIFIGTTTGYPEFNDDELSILAQDRSKYIHKILPDATADLLDFFAYGYGTGFAGVDPEAKNKYTPIIYGDFRMGGTANGYKILNNRLAPTLQVNYQRPTDSLPSGDAEYLLASHPLKSVDALWMWNNQMQKMFELHYDSGTPTNGAVLALAYNRTTVRKSDDETYQLAYVYLYPDVLAADDGENPIIFDDDSTFLPVYPGESGYGSVIFSFWNDYGDRSDEIDNGIGLFYPVYNSGGVLKHVTLQIRAEICDDVVLGSSPQHWLEIGAYFKKAGDDLFTFVDDKDTWSEYQLTTESGGTHAVDTRWLSSVNGIFWCLHGGSKDHSGIPPTEIYWKIYGASWPTGSALIDIYGIRLMIKIQYDPASLDKCFSECRGRMFGSWIDDAAHSNSFNEDDLIEHPPYIIESLLIDELGISINDIDCASFDACYDANVKMQVTLHNDERNSSYEIIKEICFQSQLALYFSEAGKWRLIKRAYTYTAANRIINEPDIVEIKSTGVSFDYICNKVNLQYYYQYELQKCTREVLLENSASQSVYGVREPENERAFRYLTAASVAYISSAFVGTYGLWSTPHMLLSVTTHGFTNADLQLGDHVQFSTDVLDKRLLQAGTTWALRDYLVVGKIQNLDSTELTLMYVATGT